MKKSKKTEIIEEEIVETTTSNVTNQGLDSNVETSFFYTNDKFINQLDDEDFYGLIFSKYPSLLSTNSTDAILKKTLTQLLEDEKFVEYILEYNNITIYDFFKVLYRRYGALFNTLYNKKVKAIIENKNYAKITKTKRSY